MAAKFGVSVDEDHSKFLRYTGYLNFINDHISHVLLLILVHVNVQPLSCQVFFTSCLTAIKTMSLKKHHC